MPLPGRRRAHGNLPAALIVAPSPERGPRATAHRSVPPISLAARSPERRGERRTQRPPPPRLPRRLDSGCARQLRQIPAQLPVAPSLRPASSACGSLASRPRRTDTGPPHGSPASVRSRPSRHGAGTASASQARQSARYRPRGSRPGCTPRPTHRLAGSSRLNHECRHGHQLHRFHRFPPESGSFTDPARLHYLTNSPSRHPPS